MRGSGPSRSPGSAGAGTPPGPGPVPPPDLALPAPIQALLDEVFFRPAHWHSAFEVAVQRLAQAIKLGALRAGSRLPRERDLVRRLGISRTTLREAIRALQEQGYLTTSRGRSGGTFVASRQAQVLSYAEARAMARAMGPALRDLLDLRAAAEPVAAELAALRATPEQVADLRWLVRAAREAPRELRRQRDSTLHITIAHTAASGLLLEMVLEEQVRLHDLLGYLAFAPSGEAAAHRWDGEHEAIVEAIASGDGAGARRVMEEHVRESAEAVRGLLDAGPRPR